MERGLTVELHAKNIIGTDNIQCHIGIQVERFVYSSGFCPVLLFLTIRTGKTDRIWIQAQTNCGGVLNVTARVLIDAPTILVRGRRG